MPDKKVYIEGFYGYRTGFMIILSTLLLGVGGSMFIRFVWALVTMDDPDKAWLLLVPTCIFGAMALIGAIITYRAVIGYTIPLIIDQLGVSYGSTFYPWAKVDSLRFWRGKGGRCHLILRCRDWVWRSEFLQINQDLTKASCTALMETLQQEVSSSFKDIKFGQSLINLL